MGQKNELDPILRHLVSLREEIRQQFRAEIVGVFGSYARRKAKRRSDIDLLVRFLEGASLFDLVALGDFLEDRLGIRVDIVSERALRPELRERILNEVVPIWDTLAIRSGLQAMLNDLEREKS
jgi:predicted nucleotidyltransferase